MSERVICPNCGNRYKGVATHWAKSSTCGYPDITTRQREILDGLLLAGAGGFSKSHERAEPNFIVHSTNPDLLNWFTNQFGVLGKPVREIATAEEAAENLAGLREASGETADAFDYNTETLYNWETRTNPNFKRIRARWNDYNDAASLPSSFDPSPLTFAVVYAIRGYLETLNSNRHERAVAFYRGGNTIGTDKEWRQLFAPFNPVIWGQTGRLILRGSEQFVQHIESVDGSPLPTLKNNPRDASLLSETDDTEISCPTCGSKFKSLKLHWTHSDCSPPHNK